MQTKHIDTQAQLREAKSDLKLQMVETDRELKENWIFAMIDKLLGGKKKKSKIDETTRDNLKFLASQQSKKIDLGKVGKVALSIGLTIAAPIIAKKLLDLKKNKI
ncbi:hypothetical protein [Moheibacter sediminis]|uniref:Uncharacterized protein n=1 Tax=Moheibacter sediminis TaxID=1434700 RepID=A0A1W2BS19_9FLAO|nr:hypothetical protein [Moheibacter sediminis]SMC75743.1 hypothetical protein SAMN06296427_10789 [Moheibacter sediminis]